MKHNPNNPWCTCFRCFLESPFILLPVAIALITLPPALMGLCSAIYKDRHPVVPICAYVYADRHVEYKTCPNAATTQKGE